MSIIYKCPFTNEQILEIDLEALKVERIRETPCPYCKTVHPLSICPREYSDFITKSGVAVTNKEGS